MVDVVPARDHVDRIEQLGPGIEAAVDQDIELRIDEEDDGERDGVHRPDRERDEEEESDSREGFNRVLIEALERGRVLRPMVIAMHEPQ